MKNIFAFLVAVMASMSVSAADPTTTLDVEEAAGGSTYYAVNLDASSPKSLTYCGYSGTGSGSTEAFMDNTSRWKLNSSRTISFKVQNCDSVALQAYFTKDATTSVKYAIGNDTPVEFLTNGTDKKCEKIGGFSTNTADEIIFTISSSNDLLLGYIYFFPATGTTSDPTLKVNPTEVTLAATAVTPKPTAKVTFSGKNLETGSYPLTIPELIGLTVSPEAVTVGTDGKLNEEVTVSYTSTTDVPTASTNLSLTIGDLSQSVKINYSATLAKKYASSINIEQWVLDNGKRNDNFKAALSNAGWDYENINDLDSLNDDKEARNEPYLGLKLKKAGAYLAGWLKTNDLLNIKFGNVAADVKINGTTVAKDDLANPYQFTASTDTYVKIETTTDKTVVIKQLMINQDIEKVTLPDEPTPEPVPVTGVTLNKSELTLAAGKTEKLTATVSPTNADDKTVSWSSNDENIATVDANGTVTAIAEGEATITVKTTDGGFTAECKVTVTEPAPPVAVTGVSLDLTEAEVKVGKKITLIASVEPEDADNKNIRWNSNNESVATVADGVVTGISAGEATITVTTEEGGFTAECIVTVSEVDPGTKEPTAIHLSLSEFSLALTGSYQLIATVEPEDAEDKTVTWSSNDESIATVDANGVVTGVKKGDAVITATTVNDLTATCKVKVVDNKLSSATLNPATDTIDVNETLQLELVTVPLGLTIDEITWSSGSTDIATVSDGLVTGVAVGKTQISAAIKVGSSSKTAKCQIFVMPSGTDPWTGDELTAHQPEIYEAEKINGGYGAKLTVVKGREYEVYYINRDGGDHLSVATSNADKMGAITTSEDKKSAEANDGWLSIHTASDAGGDTNAEAADEFQTSIRKLSMKEGDAVLLKVSGFDQFSFYGKDNGDSEAKAIIVYINGKKQAPQISQDYSIRRYDLPMGENIIKITASSTSSSVFNSFSLRLAQEPRVKWLYGNDSTQRVKATDRINPIHYFTKYNALGETKLQWEGDVPEGITLETEAVGELGDTLILTGTANCRAGEYIYHVISYYGGIETRRVTGKFKVYNHIRALTDTDVDAYQNEAIDEVQFRYYAFDPNDVHFAWLDDLTPAGIVTRAENGIFSIGGTPTEVDTFSYRIDITGGDTIEGELRVRKLDLGDNPILYLYKHSAAYDRDSTYQFLMSKGYNLITRKAKDGLRPAEQYANYKWVLISEDADANNEEVLAVARGGANLPVLNMQAFTYLYEKNEDTPNGWGEPDNGSLTPEGRYITVQRDDHPIFQALKAKRGDKIQILDTISTKGLMPINIYQKGTLCLATSLTRNKDDYYGDGEMQTFLHEIQAGMRGGKKYICMPLSLSGGAHLSPQGKEFVQAVIQYLTSEEATVSVPTLQITRFSIGDIIGTINEAMSTIHVEVDRAIYPEEVLDLTKVVPTIALASGYTHTSPAATDEVDLSWSNFAAVPFIVSDYINKRTYNVTVHTFTSEGIEEVYTIGEWVNVYDIFGRKITTTNENVYTMSLPRGVYILVTESGQTIKIAK